MQDNGYNGWVNYPTWCVNLWLSNDEGLYNATRELVESEPDDVGTDEATIARRLLVADAIRDFVLGLGVEIDNGQGGSESGQLVGFAADLLGYALDQVDWLEIADAWIEVASEVEPA